LLKFLNFKNRKWTQSCQRFVGIYFCKTNRFMMSHCPDLESNFYLRVSFSFNETWMLPYSDLRVNVVLQTFWTAVHIQHELLRLCNVPGRFIIVSGLWLKTVTKRTCDDRKSSRNIHANGQKRWTPERCNAW